MQRMWSTYLDSQQAQAAAAAAAGNGQQRIPRVPVPAAAATEMDRFSQRGRDPEPPSPTADSHSWRASSASNAHSVASSTRHLMEPARALDAPLGSLNSLTPPSRSVTPTSLSANYLPQKFAPLGSVVRRRPGRGVDVEPRIPKRGGGREAFRAGEDRMAGEGDEDDDVGLFIAKEGHGRKNPGMKWTKFKWILFAANICLTVYSLIALVFCLLTWFNVWSHADVLRVANRPELIVSTIAATLGLANSLLGWAGILLNDRPFLAWYTFILWIVFGLMVTPGYITYKTRTFNLEGKINSQWSRALGTEGRLRVQNSLQCCGYFSPFIEATVSQACYARSILHGCKGPFLRFERMVLERWYTVAFALVPLQIFCMVAGLLCSNHVTYRFGKGMMPKAYRLSPDSMAVIMDNYANQLAEQYGTDVASDILARSRSNVQLDSMPQVAYGAGAGKYDALRNK